MCLYPVTFNDHQVACRQCDQCYQADVNNWVVRAMAERAVAGQMLAITLTYSDLPNGKKPIGATVFNYKDIQNHLKVLREAYKDFYGKRGEIRYLVCGERGSKGTQRMHWHMLLFTDMPIGLLGKWETFPDLLPVSTPELETNYMWSLWSHGHIRLQKPDHKGVYYALKYAFKDRNTGQKSKGTNRHALSENWGASMFRMSKNPPIGMRYLVKYFDDHASVPAVPPSLKIQIPDYDGYWFPTGLLRKYALERCHAINSEYHKANGRDLPQWGSLLHSVSLSDENAIENDKETLTYGPQEPLPLNSGETSLNTDLSQFASELSQKQSALKSRATLKHCGSILPCKECSKFLPLEQLKDLQSEENDWFNKWAERYKKPRTESAREEFRDWWITRGRPSRGCKNRETPEHREVFQSAKALGKFARSLTGPSSEKTGRNSPGSRPVPHRLTDER